MPTAVIGGKIARQKDGDSSFLQIKTRRAKAEALNSGGETRAEMDEMLSPFKTMTNFTDTVAVENFVFCGFLFD